MSEWRKTHPLVGDARKRQTARAYARVYLTRGKITRQPCGACGAERAEMHHDDYDKPAQVRWLCRACHLAEHKAEAAMLNVKQREAA